MIVLIIEIGIAIFFGKSFHTLAFDYEKENKWLYAVIGVVSFVISLFLTAFIIGIFCALSGTILDLSLAILIELVSILIAAGITWFIYVVLKKNWKKIENKSKLDVLDDNMRSKD